MSIDLSRSPTNNSAELRLGWTEIQEMEENVHPDLALVPLFAHTEVECGKGLLNIYSFNYKTFKFKTQATLSTPPPSPPVIPFQDLGGINREGGS